MPDLLCIGGIATAVWLSWLRFRDVFTPLSIYVIVWCTAALLFCLRLINYIEITEPVVLLITGSIAAYATGCLVCPKPRNSKAMRSRFSQVAFDRVLKSLIVIHFIAFSVFLQQMNSRFGLGTYLVDPSLIRGEADDWMKLGMLGIPLYFHYPILILSFYDYLINRRLRWFNIVGLVLPFVQELLWTGRGDLVLFVVTLLFMWIYFHGWRTLNRKLMLAGLLTGAVLLSAFLAIGSAYGKLISEDTGIYDLSDFNLGSSNVLLLANPYLYVTAPLPTFQEAMGDVYYHSGGTRTFYPVARILLEIGILRDVPSWAIFDYYFVPVPNNTYTHLFTFYQDFGRSGVIIIPFLLGLLHTYWYWKMRTFPSFWTIAAVAVSVSTMCFSIFICLTSTLHVWECYVVLYLVWRYVFASESVAGKDALLLGKGPAKNA